MTGKIYTKRTKQAEQVFLSKCTTPTDKAQNTFWSFCAARTQLKFCTAQCNFQDAPCNIWKFVGYCMELTSMPLDKTQFLLTNVPLLEWSNSYRYRQNWHYVLKFMLVLVFCPNLPAFFQQNIFDWLFLTR